MASLELFIRECDETASFDHVTSATSVTIDGCSTNTDCPIPEETGNFCCTDNHCCEYGEYSNDYNFSISYIGSGVAAGVVLLIILSVCCCYCKKCPLHQRQRIRGAVLTNNQNSHIIFGQTNQSGEFRVNAELPPPYTVSEDAPPAYSSLEMTSSPTTGEVQLGSVTTQPHHISEYHNKPPL